MQSMVSHAYSSKDGKVEKHGPKGAGQQGSSPFPSPVLPVHRKQDYFDQGKGMKPTKHCVCPSRVQSLETKSLTSLALIPLLGTV